MFDIYDTSTYSEAPDGYITYNGEEIIGRHGAITVKTVTEMILEMEHFFKAKNPEFKMSKEGINDFIGKLYKLTLQPKQTEKSESQIRKDWISDDIKAMVDLQGKPLSRSRQGKIQVIRDSKFEMIKHFPEDVRKKIKNIFITCLRKREPKYRIRQEIFYLDNATTLNWDCYFFVEYELAIAGSIAYIYDEVYNSMPGEKIYFKRFEQIDDITCKKCKKLNGTLVLWSNIPLDSNKIKDEYADYAIWDDRFTEKKSKIPFTWCCDNCRGAWIRYYPNG